MNDYEIFKKNIYKLTGINLSDYKENQIKRRITTLVARHNFSCFNDYYVALTQNNKLLDEFLNHLTINVTEFFRNPYQWRILESKILPNLINNKLIPIKVWSCACSTGEEPYSLALILTKFYNLNKIRILATDIDKEVIKKAKEGIYLTRALKNVPNEFKNYFTKKGVFFELDKKIRDTVIFDKINLLEDNYPKEIDLLVCRNVLIYFTDKAKENIYTKFSKALNKDGILFLGSTESIPYPANYNLSPLGNFFYIKK